MVPRNIKFAVFALPSNYLSATSISYQREATTVFLCSFHFLFCLLVSFSLHITYICRRTGRENLSILLVVPQAAAATLRFSG